MGNISHFSLPTPHFRKKTHCDRVVQIDERPRPFVLGSAKAGRTDPCISSATYAKLLRIDGKGDGMIA